MKLFHRYCGKAVWKENNEVVGSVLANKLGDYIYLVTSPYSKYTGSYIAKDSTVYKAMHDIRLSPEIVEIVNTGSGVERRYADGSSEEFVYPEMKNGLLYLRKGEAACKVSFDCRRLYDSRRFGKVYAVYEHEGCVVVEFKKYKTPEEDVSGGECEYTLYTVFKYEDVARNDMKSWRKIETPYDTRRGDAEDLYAFDGFEFSPDKCVIVSGFDLSACVEDAKEMHKQFDALIEGEKKKAEALWHTVRVENEEVSAAYFAALNSLDMLTCSGCSSKGVYAGLPWFSQFWTRDEAISLKALMLMEQYDLVKDILMRSIERVDAKGRIPNRIPDSEIGSADGSGWMFKRTYDFITILEEKHILGKYFTRKDLLFVQKQLQMSITGIITNYATPEGLIKNDAKETWMDTTVNGEDTREGIRIEIQALQLAMYKLLGKVSSLLKDPAEKDRAMMMEMTLLKHTRKVLWNKKILADGFYDFTIRPNAFLALYIYPELLTATQKKTFAKTVIDTLWLEWGGFSSIDKSNRLFKADHTGKTNESYHRGDSWFFVNNMMALLLLQIDKNAYKDKIEKVLAASTNEILYHGAVGHHAEISSASMLESFGCHAQAWSAALYIELVKEMFG